MQYSENLENINFPHGWLKAFGLHKTSYYLMRTTKFFFYFHVQRLLPFNQNLKYINMIFLYPRARPNFSINKSFPFSSDLGVTTFQIVSFVFWFANIRKTQIACTQQCYTYLIFKLPTNNIQFYRNNFHFTQRPYHHKEIESHPIFRTLTYKKGSVNWYLMCIYFI